MSNITANESFGPDGYITTLHPEGSFNNIQYGGRVLIRPDVNYTKAAVNVIVPVIVGLGIGCWNVQIACICLGLYIVVRSRSIIIWLIHFYQHYAPAHIRLACVFEPSCSEYMILSIQKYGVIFGCIKGMYRLLRCHYPNGGEDYP